MRNFKICSFLLSLIISGNILSAQSIDDAKKSMYYEKYASAKDALLKLVAADANNVNAVYWLGQDYLELEDTASAKALYEKTLQANANAPLIMVGIGHLELLENKTNDARNRFETAISLSKGKDANVLHAIGRANVEAKAGDSLYAIEKLKLATERDKKNPDIWITLGDAYRKMTDGANAQISYQKALELNPNNAKASFMIGRLYQTQGFSQEQYYMKYYNDAIAKDPNYAPVYFWLYDYYYRRDVNKSRDYLNKYIALADPDSKNCYYQASILYASQLFQESIAKSDECITAGGTAPYPNLYGLKAYSYDKLGDSVNAKTFFDTYFQKQNPDKLGPNDYATYANVLFKFPGNDTLAAGYLEKAIALDTLEENKVKYITATSTAYVASQNYEQAARWLSKLLDVKKNVTKTDLYNVGFNYYKAGQFQTADSVFKMYQEKYPDDMVGYYYGAIAKSNIDSTSALGLALPDYEKIIELAQQSTDTARAQQQLITAYNYMINYYYNTKSDKTTALSYVDKILALDPANANALANRKALTAPPPKAKTKTETSTTKQKVTSTKTKTKTKK